MAVGKPNYKAGTEKAKKYDLVKKLINGLIKSNIPLNSMLYGHLENIKKWIDDKSYNPKDKSLDAAINQLLYGIEVDRSLDLPDGLKKIFTETKNAVAATDKNFAEWISKAHTPQVQKDELMRRQALALSGGCPRWKEIR
ncbi:MAG: hypothetical protein FWD33_01410 [Alphaproteobacteria bacterium]|nr:hypothetical protein [Alphaproteobacteria bacterium]